jgi:L,D-transpeptidase ErfK/SrfK
MAILRTILPILVALSLGGFACSPPTAKQDAPGDTLSKPLVSVPPKPPSTAAFGREVKAKDLFKVLDSIVVAHDSLSPDSLDEHLLVRMNPWVIQRLVDMDYYTAMSRGDTLDDQKECVVFGPQDSLRLPTSQEVDSLLALFRSTVIDVNIPEFRLRIVENGDTLHSFPVRVGKKKTTFLATANREVNLQTPVGKGEIVRIERYAIWMNPVDGHRYTSTLRDDRRRTALPLIPWIEPSINGQRPGTLLHPTTNPVTLGKASSNGCVGLREGDMWQVYYHAPLGTQVVFSYILSVGDTTFKDVYGRGK